MNRLWMVSYDVADAKRRSRVRKVLEGAGEPVQYSVFECFLDRRAVADLRRRLLTEIEEAEDSVRWYPLCAWCRETVEFSGKGEATGEDGYYLV